MCLPPDCLIGTYPIELGEFNPDNLVDLDALIETRLPFATINDIARGAFDVRDLRADRLLPIFREAETETYLTGQTLPLTGRQDILVETSGGIKSICILGPSGFSVSALLQLDMEKLSLAYEECRSAVRQCIPYNLFRQAYESAVRVLVSLIKDDAAGLDASVRVNIFNLIWFPDSDSGVRRSEIVFMFYACLKLVAYQLSVEPHYRELLSASI